MRIADILTREAVKAPLEATDKKSAIFELIDVLHDAGLITNPDTLKEVVWEREQQRTTGIGEGLAIPHGKSDCSKNLVMAIGRPAVPIDFGSIDKKPVRLVVLLASPPTKTAEHIKALGTISRLMVNAEFREETFNAETCEDLYALFRDAP
jgi:fructose-specific phosphotransferase system IIA component